MSDHKAGVVADDVAAAATGVAGYRPGQVQWDGGSEDSDRALKFVNHLSVTFDEAFTLLRRKHKDYGPTNISRAPGGPLNGLRVRMWDKLARINHLIDSDRDPENESLRDSFVDLANYSIIAMMVLDGNWPEK